MKTEVRPPPPLWAVTLTVMIGLSMAIIDTSIINVALPTIGGNLGSTSDEIAWVATGYILANVIIMPLNGWLTAFFGRKKYYAACLLIFTLASLLCGTARTTYELVAWRVLQGLGGGALQPTAQSILFESFPPEKRGQGMALFGLGAMVGPAIGPTLGGYLVDNYSWPLIFFINIPLGALAFFMTLAFIRDPDYVKKPVNGIDVTALSLLVIGLSSLQYVLERGQREDWFDSRSIVALTVTAVATLVIFAVREWRDPTPIVRVRIFRIPSFTLGSLIGIVSGFGLYGLNLVIPQFLQGVLGLTPTDTGLALAPGAGATAVSMLAAPRLIARVGARGSIVCGLLLFALGSWQLSGLTQYSGVGDIFWPRVIQGFALGFLFVPLTTVALARIRREEMPDATGLYTLLRQLGGSIGIAVLVLLQTRLEESARHAYAAGVTSTNVAAMKLLGAAGTQNTAALRRMAAEAARSANIAAYDVLFQVCALLFVVSVPLVFFLGAPRTLGTEEGGEGGGGGVPAHAAFD